MADHNNIPNHDYKNEYKRKLHNNEVINPVIAGAAGVVIGAGVAIAGAVALKDEKNRAKVKEIFNKMKDQTSEAPQDTRTSAIKIKSQIQDKTPDSKTLNGNAK